MSIIDKVNISGYELSYAKFGKGSKPFVMIPGVYLTSVLNSADAVEEQYSQFLDEYTLYLLDNCAKLKQNDTIDVIVDHDIYLLDKLGIKDAYVLATSHGGLTC